MLLAETAVEPGCRLGLLPADAGSLVVPGLGGGADRDGDATPWSGLFDGDLSAARRDDCVMGPWRLRPELGVSAAAAAAAAVGGGSCGSDAATSPSYSPAESSTGSAA